MKGLRKYVCLQLRSKVLNSTHIHVSCETKILGNANCRRSGLKQFSLSSNRHRYHSIEK